MRRVQLDDGRLAAMQEQVERMQASLHKILEELHRLRMRVARDELAAGSGPMKTLRAARWQADRECLLAAGEQSEWNRSAMARLLDVERKIVYRKLKQHGLDGMGQVSPGVPFRRAAVRPPDRDARTQPRGRADGVTPRPGSSPRSRPSRARGRSRST